MRKEQVADAVKKTELFEARSESDTLRLWENYREQALMWRALALLQIPTSILLVILSIVLWVTRQVTFNIPNKPLPGIHLAGEIPNEEFVERATNFINLIATYQPYTARRQLSHARELIHERFLAQFNTDYVENELKAIETTSRTQIFFADPSLTKVERPNNREVIVTFTGERLKLVAGRELPVVYSRYAVSLTTIPRQDLNPYGIVISNLSFDAEVRR